jgi:hypothetical protein
MSPPEAATTFLTTVFAGAPAGTALVLSSPREHWRAHVVASDDPHTAARIALRLGADVFIGVGLQDAAAARARTGRGRTADVVALTAVTCDLDIAKADAKKRYLPTRAAARRFLTKLPIRPTVTIFTGGGYHSWWCFKEVLVFDTAAACTWAERLVWRWHGFLRLRLGSYALDSTHDLARVLRVPGTVNRKYKTLVVLEDAGGPRVDPGELEDVCINVPDVEHPSRLGALSLPFALDPDGEPPFRKFGSLCRSSPLFAQLWRREIAPKDRSQSGFDYRLATLAAAEGWTDDELVRLLIAHRRAAGKPPKHTSYYARTLAAARTAAEASRGRAAR